MLEFFAQQDFSMEPVAYAHRRIGEINALSQDIRSNGLSSLAEIFRSDRLRELADLEAFLKEARPGSSPSLPAYWGYAKREVKQRLFGHKALFRNPWEKPLYFEPLFPEDHGITIVFRSTHRLTIRHRTEGEAEVAAHAIHTGPCEDWTLYVFPDTEHDHRVALCCLPPGLVLVKYAYKKPARNVSPVEESPLSAVQVPA